MCRQSVSEHLDQNIVALQSALSSNPATPRVVHTDPPSHNANDNSPKLVSNEDVDNNKTIHEDIIKAVDGVDQNKSVDEEENKSINDADKNEENKLIDGVDRIISVDGVDNVKAIDDVDIMNCKVADESNKDNTEKLPEDKENIENKDTTIIEKTVSIFSSSCC